MDIDSLEIKKPEEVEIERIGNYPIEILIGKGGMGQVFKAKDDKLKRIVAIKMISFNTSSKTERLKLIEMFHNEAQILAKTNHQNIVKIYSFDVDKNRPYFVMEYIEGEDLERFLIRKAENATPKNPLGISQEEIVEIFIQVAEAINYAHGIKIIHRDIKPSNIMIRTLTPEERKSQKGNRMYEVKVMDFGLAQFKEKITHGSFQGTVNYMSPEQCKRRIITEASDIYSLGATFYRAITGKCPTEGPAIKRIIAQICDLTALAPVRSNPNLSITLSNICLKCLKKAIPDRYPSAAAFADDLKKFLKNEKTSVDRPDPVKDLTKWVNAHKKIAITLVVMTILFPVLLFHFIAQSIRAEDAAKQWEKRYEDLRKYNNDLSKDFESLVKQERLTSDQKKRLILHIKRFKRK